LDHWKKGGDLLKAVPLVIDIGKRYEKWGFSALAIDVYDDGINIIAKQDNLSDESTDQLIAGFPHSTLSEMSSIAIKFLIVLFIEKGKCFANLGNRRATGSNYLDAYHVSI